MANFRDRFDILLKLLCFFAENYMRVKRYIRDSKNFTTRKLKLMSETYRKNKKNSTRSTRSNHYWFLIVFTGVSEQIFVDFLLFKL